MDEPGILVALRIKGMARPEDLAASVGAGEDDVAVLVAAGLAEPGPLGLRLTPAGVQRAEAVLAGEREAAHPAAVRACCARFDAVNGPLKQVVNEWLVRPVGGAEQPNDHADAAYDAGVLDRLGALHEQAAEVVRELATLVPRLARYGERLEAALGRARAGEARFVAAPLVDSYHTVWFELHEELIRLSGRTRAAEAAAGRAL